MFFCSPRLNGWRTRWLSETTPSTGRSASRASALWRFVNLVTLMEVCTPAEPRMTTEKQLSAASLRSNVSKRLDGNNFVLNCSICFTSYKIFTFWMFLLNRADDCGCRQEIGQRFHTHRSEVIHLLFEYSYFVFMLLVQIWSQRQIKYQSYI